MHPEDFELLRRIVKSRSGLTLSPDKAYLLENRLMAVARKWGMNDIEGLAATVRGTPNEELLREITEAMTTNETLFFRDQSPFEQLEKVVLPRLLESRQGTRHIRIWSAGCSSGQEPYSVAMVLKQLGSVMDNWRVDIVATDISRTMLDKARAGLYTQFEVQRGLPIAMLMKYFSQAGDKWELDPGIRAMVHFDEFNLLNDPAPLGRFDVVFCRNVLIYLDQPTKGRVLENIRSLMPDDGVLYMGGAETVMGVTEKFQPVSEHRGMYEIVSATAGNYPRGTENYASNP
ncbi:MAG: protein-glutamate O-methyltransferase [Rhodospirillales bacterium]|nr:MAG: protein-glutamate O-methyltransferase [Rhodospirillales bacterium]